MRASSPSAVSDAVSDLREGDHFGEIALLEDGPRTATVRAITDGAVWALDQEEFLATVTGLPQAATAAHAVSAERRRASVAPRAAGSDGGVAPPR